MSPALFWSGVPQGTESLAVVVDDPDAPGKTFLHWLAYDLPATTTSLPEGVPPRSTIEGGGTQARNDFGEIGWGGPCPPSGTHSYVFTLYALSGKVEVAARATRDDFLKAVAGRTLAQSRLVGRYARAPRSGRG